MFFIKLNELLENLEIKEFLNISSYHSHIEFHINIEI